MGNGCFFNPVTGSLIGGLIGFAVGMIGFSFLCANSESMVSAPVLIISAIFAVGFIWAVTMFGVSIAFGALIVGVLGYVIYKIIKNNPPRGL